MLYSFQVYCVGIQQLAYITWHTAHHVPSFISVTSLSHPIPPPLASGNHLGLFRNLLIPSHNCSSVLKTRPCYIDTYIIKYRCLILLKTLLVWLFFIWLHLLFISPVELFKKTNNLHLRQSSYLKWFRNPRVTTQKAMVMTLMLPTNIVWFISELFQKSLSSVNFRQTLQYKKRKNSVLVGTSVICFEKQSSLHYDVFGKKSQAHSSGLCMLCFILWSVLWPLIGSLLSSLFTVFSFCSLFSPWQKK